MCYSKRRSRKKYGVGSRWEKKWKHRKSEKFKNVIFEKNFEIFVWEMFLILNENKDLTLQVVYTWLSKGSFSLNKEWSLKLCTKLKCVYFLKSFMHLYEILENGREYYKELFYLRNNISIISKNRVQVFSIVKKSIYQYSSKCYFYPF